jgi:hypothetical protein
MHCGWWLLQIVCFECLVNLAFMYVLVVLWYVGSVVRFSVVYNFGHAEVYLNSVSGLSGNEYFQ